MRRNIIILIFIAVIFWGWGLGEKERARRLPKETLSVAVSLPRPTHSVVVEDAGNEKTYALVLKSPGKSPDYKWQFLKEGVKHLIDRKDQKGWIPLIDSIAGEPEYKTKDTLSEAFIWKRYVLKTKGEAVLQGYEKKENPDGTITLTRWFDTAEEGVPEIFSESWKVPSPDEDMGESGPKATYQMTKNRIAEVPGIGKEEYESEEGLWRLRWRLSGIKEITEDHENILDNNHRPILGKFYNGHEFRIDVADFYNIKKDPKSHVYSEYAAGNRVEILFFKDGTNGERIVDPTTVTSDVAVGWLDSSQHLTHFDGTNFYLFYEKGSGDANIYWKSSTDGTTWGAEQSFSPTNRTGGAGWDIWWEDDTNGVIGWGGLSGTKYIYIAKIALSAGPAVTISGTESKSNNTANSNITVTMTNNTVYVLKRFGTGSVTIYKRSASGYPDGAGNLDTTASLEGTAPSNDTISFIPYSADKVLGVFGKNPGGTASDGWYLRTWDGTTLGTQTEILAGSNSLVDVELGPTGIRVSDTDFRIVIAATSTTTIGTLGEWKWDDSTVALNATIDATNIAYKQVSIMYARTEGDLYMFAQDSGAANTPIYRYKNTGAAAWGTRTQVDASEATARSRPVTQHSEPPPSATGTRTPRYLVWAYRVVNVGNFDLVVGTLQLAASSSTTWNGFFFQW